MFNRKPKERTKLEDTIDQAHAELAGLQIEDENYQKGVDQLIKLYEIQRNNKPDGVSKDTLVSTLGSIAGILVIVMYEQKHVMASKATSIVKLFR